MWDQVLNQPTKLGSTVVHLAEHGGYIVGFGACGSQRTEDVKEKGYDGEVSAIYILREHQRHGLGARLLRVMATDLLSRSFSATALWVVRENESARRFYERHGTQIITEREEPRGETILKQLAYGWPDLLELRARRKTESHAL